MKPILKNILCRKVNKETKQGLLILTTKTDFNEYEIVALGNKVHENVNVGDVVKIASHNKGVPIDCEKEVLYMFKEEDIHLFG